MTYALFVGTRSRWVDAGTALLLVANAGTGWTRRSRFLVHNLDVKQVPGTYADPTAHTDDLSNAFVVLGLPSTVPMGEWNTRGALGEWGDE